MKRVFLLIVVPALLVAIGFAQTPAASGNTDQINIQGCLGGTDGNYSVAEENTGKVFKITTSTADLRAYLGQDVKLTGHKAGTAENSLAVIELNMISEHCTAAAAAPAASISTPAASISTPSAASAAPDGTAPAATVSTFPDTAGAPAVAAAPTVAPAASVSTPAASISTPPAASAAPDATASVATASTLPKTASAPAAAAAVHRTRAADRPPKPAVTPAATPAPAEPVSTAGTDTFAPTAPVGAAPETANTPAAPATKPVTSRSLWMLVSIVVVVILIGGAVPLYNRWRKGKLLEQTRGQNLSFTHKASSDPGSIDTTGGRKAA